MVEKTVQLGWQTAQKAYSIKQGAQGSVQLRLKVRNDDGSPLPSYNGFTGKFTLMTGLGKLVQDFTVANGCLAIMGDGVNNEVIVTLIFKSVNTALYPAGQKLLGDLKLILPTGGECQYPYEMTLDVKRSFAL